MEKKIFGTVTRFISVVDFQKCGLPHVHILIILEHAYKIRDVEQFDEFVCSEIPNNENPHLRAAVLQHMMHGPCGDANPSCPCMKKKGFEKTYKNGYPKNFSNFTTAGDDSYPVYRHRDTKETVCVREVNLDNCWVIPYNSYLLAKFDCHLNVEVCSTIKAVKYLYKYVYKGHDHISFSILQANNGEPYDEIQNYQAGRWVSPPEAAWRICGFPLFEIHPVFIPLQLYLPDMQFMQFSSNEELVDVVTDDKRARTMLTNFFRVNSERPKGPHYLYTDFPQHFIWDDHNIYWRDRQRGKTVGCLVYATPAEGERYYLRLLLTNVRGPKTFADLLTVDGHKCATFKEASLMRGLLEHDDSINLCMDEGIQVQMPCALRRLFVTLLIFCQPSD